MKLPHLSPKTKKYGWLILVALIAIGIGWSMTREQPVTATAVAVKRGPIREFILEDGKTRLAREYVVTLPVPADLPRLTWQIGDWVTQGQPLLQVRSVARSQEIAALHAKLSEIQAQRHSIAVNQTQPEDLNIAQSRIQEARHQLEQSRRQHRIQAIEWREQERLLERQKQLHASGAIDRATLELAQKHWRIGQQQLQQVQAQEKTSKAALTQAEMSYRKLRRTRYANRYQHQVFTAQANQIMAQLKIKQNELYQSLVRSPVSGPVLEIYSPDAGPQPAGAKLLKLGDLTSLECETDVLSEEIHLLRVGLPVEISGKALQNEVIQGKISRIYPSGFTKLSALGVEQQRFKVLIRLGAHSHKLYPGTHLDVRLITAQRLQTVLIPERALFKQNGQWQVFKLDHDSRAQLQAVTVGLKNDAEAEIIKGLQPGDLILLEPDNTLKPGAKIIKK